MIRGVVIFDSEQLVSGKVREHNSTMGKANVVSLTWKGHSRVLIRS